MPLCDGSENDYFHHKLNDSVFFTKNIKQTNILKCLLKFMFNTNHNKLQLRAFIDYISNPCVLYFLQN